MKEYKLGFIGCGHMGFAIAEGIKEKGFEKAENIFIYDIQESIMNKCRAEGFLAATSLKELCDKSEIIVLATTPQISDDILKEIKNYEIKNILSIVTGLSTDYINSYCKDASIVRAMPNTPLQIGYGATALCANKGCDKDIYAYIKGLFASIGLVEEVEENQFALLVSVHGSTPAYFYYYLECIFEDLVDRGFDEKIARCFLVETMIGSGEMLKKEKDKPITDFVDAVCSPGGTTIQAINHLKDNSLKDLIKEANEKCINRAKEFEK